MKKKLSYKFNIVNLHLFPCAPLTTLFVLLDDLVLPLLVDDGVLLFLADDLNSFSCPSVNAESNFLLTDSAIDNTSSNIADCH